MAMAQSTSKRFVFCIFHLRVNEVKCDVSGQRLSWFRGFTSHIMYSEAHISQWVVLRGLGFCIANAYHVGFLVTPGPWLLVNSQGSDDFVIPSLS